jgi:hypothetical protein
VKWFLLIKFCDRKDPAYADSDSFCAGTLLNIPGLSTWVEQSGV